MAAVTVDGGPGQSLFEPGRGSVLIVNNDESDLVYAGPNRRVSRTDTPIEPQGSVVLDGSVRYYASTVGAGEVEVLVIPGGLDWQNPVGVQVALATLGLATAELQGSQMSVGIPPNVPAVAAVDALNQAPADSPVTVYTFTAPGRVWGVNLSVTAAASSAYAGGFNRVFALAEIGTTTPLAAIELAINAASQISNDTVYVPFNGLQVVDGAKLMANINGGVSITLATVVASIVFYYSIP